MADYKLVGKNFTPPDMVAKVTGAAKYAEDFRAEGMLHAKLLLSPMPHARVRNIDTSAAMKMKGVVAIITPGGRAAVPAAGRSDPVQGADLCRRADPGGGGRIRGDRSGCHRGDQGRSSSSSSTSSIRWIRFTPAASTPTPAATSPTSGCHCRRSSGRPRTSRASTRARCPWASRPRNGPTAISKPASRRPR